MEDLAYLCSDSTAAWLAGRANRRVEQYERFYRGELAREKQLFDLEQANERYAQFVAAHGPKAHATWVQLLGKAAVVTIGIYFASEIIKIAGTAGPKGTFFAAAVIFVGLRIARKRARKA